MFLSKRNDLIYPQSEHVALATVIATHWGNDRFEKPPVPRASFIRAVANHDNGYGHYDTNVIGEQTEENLVRLWKRSTDQALNDPFAEIIIKRHFMRLAAFYTINATFPLVSKFHDELETTIQELYKKHNVTKHIFDVTDTVMNACEAISFSFCLGETVVRELDVYPNATGDHKITITFSIHQNHTIVINPYPLDEAVITGTIRAYDKTDYPKILLPNEINFQLMKQL
jgi:hypothetical protein